MAAVGSSYIQFDQVRERVGEGEGEEGDKGGRERGKVKGKETRSALCLWLVGKLSSHTRGSAEIEMDIY